MPLAGFFVTDPRAQQVHLDVQRRMEKCMVVSVATVPTYTEGVVLDHAGNIYFSHSSRITRVGADGKARTWAEPGSPNGHKLLADGTHLVCDRQAAVFHLDANGTILGRASSECDGKPLRSPNDLCLDPKGGFYFTDPGGSREAPIGTVHYVEPKGKTHLVAGEVFFPNGIVLRPDGKTLLVAESKRNRILEFPVLSPGRVGARRVFADLPARKGAQLDNQPDGMALDEAGNLYVAHYGMGQVQVLDPRGKLLRSVETGHVFTSNVAFGGPEMNWLYVTGSVGPTEQTTGVLKRIQLPGVRGMRILPLDSR